MHHFTTEQLTLYTVLFFLVGAAIGGLAASLLYEGKIRRVNKALIASQQSKQQRWESSEVTTWSFPKRREHAVDSTHTGPGSVVARKQGVQASRQDKQT